MTLQIEPDRNDRPDPLGGLLVIAAFCFPGRIEQVVIAGLVGLVLLARHRRIATEALDANGILLVAASALLFVASLLTRIVIDPNFVTLRDLGEFGRWAPPLLIVALGARVIALQWSTLVNAVILYLVADLAASVLQLTATAQVRPLFSLFNSPLHYANSLTLSRRALGLSASPGEHGAAAAAALVIMLAAALNEPRSRHMIGVALATTTLLLSQSQTSFLAAAAAVTVTTAVTMLRRPLRPSTRRAVMRLGVISIVALPLAIWAVGSRLRYLGWLFRLGTKRSSYQLRELQWEPVLRKWFDEPLFVLFGGGKSPFNNLTTAVDSDFIYLLVTYGVLWSALFAVLIVAGIASPLLRQPSPRRVALCGLWVAALVSSWANAFLKDIHLMTLVALVYVSTNPPWSSGTSAESQPASVPASVPARSR